MAVLAVFASAPCTIILKVGHAERNFIIWPVFRNWEHSSCLNVDCTRVSSSSNALLLLLLFRGVTIIERFEWARFCGAGCSLPGLVSLAEGAVVEDGCSLTNFCVFKKLGETLDALEEGGLSTPGVLG